MTKQSPKGKNINHLEWLTITGFGGLFLLPRLIGLAKFATLDEPYWLVSGSNFFYAISRREIRKHGLGLSPGCHDHVADRGRFALYFPAYRGQGQGYFYLYKEWKYEAFLNEFGKHAVDVLFYGRLLQLVLLTGLFILLYWLMQKLLDRRLTIAALLFIAFDPYVPWAFAPAHP